MQSGEQAMVIVVARSMRAEGSRTKAWFRSKLSYKSRQHMDPRGECVDG